MEQFGLAVGVFAPAHFSVAGRKMSAVKSLHQTSNSNTKPAFIMGHSYEAHALLLLLAALQLPEPVLLVADAYYACGKIVAGLLDRDGHLISRLQKNACAYTVPAGPRRAGRGRPKLYGTKIRLHDLFAGPLAAMPSPVYDEQNVTLRWTCRDLLWRPAGRLVRFVAVVHPQRGAILLLSTDLTLAPAEIIRLYALRFKIELSFKHALHSVGSWAYHFWMRPMTPPRRNRRGMTHGDGSCNARMAARVTPHGRRRTLSAS